GGRLAMVLPGELGYAKYALPVLDYLTRSFGKIILLTFKKKLFPGLSEDTLLLLAQDKGKNTSRVLHRDLEGDGSLKDVKVSKNYSLGGVRGVPTSPILTKRQRLIEYLLPKKTRELYNEVKEAEHVYRLGDLADVGIGYVTGANDFFHLSPDQIKYFKIPKRFLKNAVKRSRAFRGLEFTQSDWDSALVRGESGYLLSINPQAELSTELSEYLRMGEEKGVSNAYKCRVRKPWYSVPHVFEPDGFLSYMSTGFPNLVTNGAGAVAPNTLHVLRLREPARISSSDIATSWPTSLTRLSVEIEGHSLGGGMLKLEPTEAENCLVAFTGDRRGDLQELALEMDRLLRLGNDRKATERADKMLLRKSLNLSVSDCRLLMDGAELLRNRRAKRSERG
ncbi:MAG TPA: hypothetical protein VFQ43_00525, partial [Nitrososphaera sp.]|nr:hypothetical protein [Nitrososphaera sp.]